MKSLFVPYVVMFMLVTLLLQNVLFAMLALISSLNRRKAKWNGLLNTL